MRFKRKFCKLSGLIAEPVRGICPEGWYLPTEEEFKILVSSAGGGEVAGKVLKFTSWIRCGKFKAWKVKIDFVAA